MDFEVQFRAAMEADGMGCPDQIIPDGKIHRFQGAEIRRAPKMVSTFCTQTVTRLVRMATGAHSPSRLLKKSWPTGSTNGLASG